MDLPVLGWGTKLEQNEGKIAYFEKCIHLFFLKIILIKDLIDIKMNKEKKKRRKKESLIKDKIEDNIKM